MAMILPYGLKYLYLNGTHGVFDSECYSKSVKYKSNYNFILRPLSDLTKEIEHKGETLIPVDKLGWGRWFSK